MTDVIVKDVATLRTYTVRTMQECMNNSVWGGSCERTYFDVRVFNPHAPSNRHHSGTQTRVGNTNSQKERAYEQRICEVEHHLHCLFCLPLEVWLGRLTLSTRDLPLCYQRNGTKVKHTGSSIFHIFHECMVTERTLFLSCTYTGKLDITVHTVTGAKKELK